MSSLTVIMQMLHKIEAAILENNGEITEDLNVLFDLAQGAFEEKIDNYAHVIDRSELLAEGFKNKAEEFYAASKSSLNLIKNLKDRLKFHSADHGADLVGNDYRFKLSNSKPKLVIECSVDMLPATFVNAETIFKPNTEAIRQYLEAGFELDGCRLETTQSIRKYVNKKELP